MSNLTGIKKIIIIERYIKFLLTDEQGTLEKVIQWKKKQQSLKDWRKTNWSSSISCEGLERKYNQN